MAAEIDSPPKNGTASTKPRLDCVATGRRRRRRARSGGNLSLSTSFRKNMSLITTLSRLIARIGPRRLYDAHGGGKFWAGRGVRLPKAGRIGAWTYIQKDSYVGHGARIGRY